MLTVAYFCVATEMKLLNEINKSSLFQTTYDPKLNNHESTHYNSEIYHSKTVEFSVTYLPNTCPIVKHYISSYHKHYQSNLKPIVNTSFFILL